MDTKLREEASREDENERERERKREKVAWKIEGRKGEKLNLEVCLISFSFIKVAISVTHTAIYSLGSFLEKQVLHPSNS